MNIFWETYNLISRRLLPIDGKTRFFLLLTISKENNEKKETGTQAWFSKMKIAFEYIRISLSHVRVVNPIWAMNWLLEYNTNTQKEREKKRVEFNAIAMILELAVC